MLKRFRHYIRNEPVEFGVFAAIVFVIVVSLFWLIFVEKAYGWEGDDGGVDQWEVQVGRYADRVNNQMQLTEPPPPPEILGVLGRPIAPFWMTGCDEMNFYRVQWGLPGVFSSLGWRESNCRNEDGVHTSCCHGYWQLHRIHFDGSGYVYGHWCAAYSYFDVNSNTSADKQRQACAARALYDQEGLSPW